MALVRWFIFKKLNLAAAILSLTVDTQHKLAGIIFVTIVNFISPSTFTEVVVVLAESLFKS